MIKWTWYYRLVALCLIPIIILNIFIWSRYAQWISLLLTFLSFAFYLFLIFAPWLFFEYEKFDNKEYLEENEKLE